MDIPLGTAEGADTDTRPPGGGEPPRGALGGLPAEADRGHPLGTPEYALEPPGVNCRYSPKPPKIGVIGQGRLGRVKKLRRQLPHDCLSAFEGNRWQIHWCQYAASLETFFNGVRPGPNVSDETFALFCREFVQFTVGHLNEQVETLVQLAQAAREIFDKPFPLV